MCELTSCSFVHKVQFVVEVGQFGVLLLDDERDVVQQRDLPVGGLGVQQLNSTKQGEFCLSREAEKSGGSR